ncbi:hypothetical protein HJG53_07830 [Sphingomonas sp. ID1715]|nr:hypothetical protein [Sphingomonas sp. ID1715]
MDRPTQFNPNPYIPKTIGELRDHVISLVLNAPKFEYDFAPWLNIDTDFFALKSGLERLRSKLGDETCERLMKLADEAKTHFAADPEDSNGGADIGRELLVQMDDIIAQSRSRRRNVASTGHIG